MQMSNQLELNQLLPVVYDEMRKLASRIMSGERAGHSFQTTELVHEAYMRMAKLERIDWTNRNHVCRVAVGVMRRVLIDYARRHKARKRDPKQLLLLGSNHGYEDHVNPLSNVDLLALDEALKGLRELDGRKAEIVELRYFGGQSIESVSEILEISISTVKRDWALAKAWLHRELCDDTVSQP